MVLERAGGLIGQGVAGEDAGAHHACGTQVAHQLAGVDVAQADDAVLGEVVVQAAFGTQLLTFGEGSRTMYPATQMREDSGSSLLTPVSPMCGNVCTTIWRS